MGKNLSARAKVWRTSKKKSSRRKKKIILLCRTESSSSLLHWLLIHGTALQMTDSQLNKSQQSSSRVAWNEFHWRCIKHYSDWKSSEDASLWWMECSVLIQFEIETRGAQKNFQWNIHDDQFRARTVNENEMFFFQAHLRAQVYLFFFGLFVLLLPPPLFRHVDGLRCNIILLSSTLSITVMASWWNEK